MKKTFCDKCGDECSCNGQIQRFTIFDVNKDVDLCDSCYTKFASWILRDGELFTKEN